MKVEILRGVMVKGEPAQVGSIIDLEANDAFLLISSNKAIAATEELTVEPAPVEPEATAEPELAVATLQAEEVLEIAPVRRTRKPRSSKE
jgi:hypothetical protein